MTVVRQADRLANRPKITLKDFQYSAFCKCFLVFNAGFDAETLKNTFCCI